MSDSNTSERTTVQLGLQTLATENSASEGDSLVLDADLNPSFGSPSGGSNPFVGDVVKLTGTTSQSIPDSEWTQLDLSAHAVVTNPQDWASVVGTDLVIDPTAGILVVTQGWIVWATSAVGAVRALLIAHGGGGTPEFLDDMPIMLTPDQYAALSDFEGSMGGEVTNRVDPTDGLSLQFWVYQDSGGALNCDFGISFVTPVA